MNHCRLNDSNLLGYDMSHNPRLSHFKTKCCWNLAPKLTATLVSNLPICYCIYLEHGLREFWGNQFILLEQFQQMLTGASEVLGNENSEHCSK